MNDAKLNFEKGIAFTEEEDFENGEIHFQLAITQGFKDKDAFAFLAFAQAALEKHDEAVKNYKKSLEYGRNDSWLLEGLAGSLRESKHYTESIEYYEKSFLKGIPSPDLYYNLAMSYKAIFNAYLEFLGSNKDQTEAEYNNFKKDNAYFIKENLKDSMYSIFEAYKNLNDYFSRIDKLEIDKSSLEEMLEVVLKIKELGLSQDMDKPILYYKKQIRKIDNAKFNLY